MGGTRINLGGESDFWSRKDIEMPRDLKPKIRENGVTTTMIIITTIFFLLVMFLTIPNIYLDNNIYYESREIAHYENIAKMLREEHIIIRHRLEEVKYQENVLNQE
jgi:hypothetical protein